MRKKEINPEIKIINNIKINVFGARFPVMSLIATAAPVLVFEIVYKEINEKPITKVFVAPRRIKKSFIFDFLLVRVFPIIAACPDPSPGRKLHNGEAISAPRRGLAILYFKFGFVSF